MKKNSLIILAFSFLVISCKKDTVEKLTIVKANYSFVKLNANRKNLNISILLDVSDRINPKKYPNPTMDFYKRDIGYIKSITQSFETHIRNKKSRKINDKIQLFLNPESSDKALNERINKLRIKFTKDNAKKGLILKTTLTYQNNSKLIYESAIKDNKYVGSDIWGFFKNKVKDYCIEENYKNILIILTDGYLYHKDNKRKEKNRTTYVTSTTIKNNRLNTSNWKEKIASKHIGFIPAIDNLQNLSVLVLGINPNKKNPYEEDVIKEYWRNWFRQMKVENFKIQNADLPTNVDKVIKTFIFEESN